MSFLVPFAIASLIGLTALGGGLGLLLLTSR